MNKPPGYYKDERGREYYWDGQHRSYIPETLGELNRRAGEGLISLVTGIYPVMIVVFGLLIGFLGLLIGGFGGFFVGVMFWVVVVVIYNLVFDATFGNSGK